MKTPRIAEAIGHIDEDLVSGAVSYKRATKKSSFIKWGALAACFAVVIMAVALIVSMLGRGELVSLGGIDRNYKNSIRGNEGDIEWPWEYKTIYEKYYTVTFDGREYGSRASAIDEALLGEALGTCTGEGVDSYTDKKYTETFEVRKINGVSADRMIAIGMDDDFYVYFNSKATKPATFGEVLDLYGLEQTLPLIHFSVNEGLKEQGYYRIADDAYIWQVLSECSDAEAYADTDSWNRNDRNYLSFTATSEALGVYKKVFYITEDGYVSTNIFNYSYVYFIGEEAANKIITHAKSIATEAEREPYEYTLAGTLTEIGDGYILIDDTVLCVDPDEGMVFKVLTDDIRIRRCYEAGSIKVGDHVVVRFTGFINTNDNSIAGAYDMSQGILVDGDVAVLE